MPDPAAAAVGARPSEVLRRLELTVTRRLDGLLQGDYQGLVPGHGAETGETRPYVPGDDVRRIDWNVTARSMQAHVRETIADRELETWLLVDRSPSLDFGTAATTKAELATAAVAAVGFLTARTGNRLGAIVVGPGPATDGGRSSIRVLPARQGRDHLLALLHGLVTAPVAQGGGTTDLELALRHLVVPPRRRGLVVAISDFLAPPGWERPLRALSHRHDVLAIEVVDQRELELPAVGLLSVVDPETGRSRDVPTNRRTRARYAAAATAQRAAIAEAIRRAGASHLQLRTDRDWLLDIVRFVAARRRARGDR